MADELRQTVGDITVDLKPGRGGCFEVSRDGTLIYSKNKTGRFPEDGEIRQLLVDK